MNKNQLTELLETITTHLEHFYGTKECIRIIENNMGKECDKEAILDVMSDSFEYVVQKIIAEWRDK